MAGFFFAENELYTTHYIFSLLKIKDIFKKCILYMKCFVFEYAAKFIVQLLCVVVLTCHSWNNRLGGKPDYGSPDLINPWHKLCVTCYLI